MQAVLLCIIQDLMQLFYSIYIITTFAERRYKNFDDRALISSVLINAHKKICSHLGGPMLHLILVLS